jgi:hypothetical protein
MHPIVMRSMGPAGPTFARASCLVALAGTLLGCEFPSASPELEPGTPPNLLVAADPTADRYPNVALMVGRAGSDPWRPSCTGTLIAPNVVLTAGHCVAFGQAFERFTEFGVTFDPMYTSSSRVIRVTAHVHPEYEFRFPTPLPDNPVDLSDLAVLVLDEPVGLTPAKLPPLGILDGIAASSGPLTFVGYGITRPDADFGERGTRRAGTVRLSAVHETVAVTSPDPAVGCVGDSGGPLLLGPAHAAHGRRGATMVLGVAHSADCATFTTFYRVDTPKARAFLGAYLDLPGSDEQ